MGQPRGRPPGTTGKNKISLQERADALGVDPFEFLAQVVRGDWKALGIRADPDSLEPIIPLDMRLSAAKELSQYLHAKRSAVKISTDEESGFKVVIENYLHKDSK